MEIDKALTLYQDTSSINLFLHQGIVELGVNFSSASEFVCIVVTGRNINIVERIETVVIVIEPTQQANDWWSLLARFFGLVSSKNPWYRI